MIQCYVMTLYINFVDSVDSKSDIAPETDKGASTMSCRLAWRGRNLWMWVDDPMDGIRQLMPVGEVRKNAAALLSNFLE